MSKNAEHVAVMKEIRATREDVGRLDRDFSKHLQELSDLTVKVQNLTNEVEALKKATYKQVDKTRDAVADVVAPVIEEAQNLSEQIENKKTMIIREPFKIWLYLKRWFVR